MPSMHMSPVTNKPERCQAKEPEGCRYGGGTVHGATEAEVYQAYEEKMREEGQVMATHERHAEQGSFISRSMERFRAWRERSSQEDPEERRRRHESLARKAQKVGVGMALVATLAGGGGYVANHATIERPIVASQEATPSGSYSTTVFAGKVPIIQVHYTYKTQIRHDDGRVELVQMEKKTVGERTTVFEWHASPAKAESNRL